MVHESLLGSASDWIYLAVDPAVNGYLFWIIRQARKERAGLHLSFAMPKIQWAFSPLPRTPLRPLGYGKLYLFYLWGNSAAVIELLIKWSSCKLHEQEYYIMLWYLQADSFILRQRNTKLLTSRSVPSLSEGIIDHTGAQTMLCLSCTMYPV